MCPNRKGRQWKWQKKLLQWPSTKTRQFLRPQRKGQRQRTSSSCTDSTFSSIKNNHITNIRTKLFHNKAKFFWKTGWFKITCMRPEISLKKLSRTQGLAMGHLPSIEIGQHIRLSSTCSTSRPIIHDPTVTSSFRYSCRMGLTWKSCKPLDALPRGTTRCRPYTVPWYSSVSRLQIYSSNSFKIPLVWCIIARNSGKA